MVKSQNATGPGPRRGAISSQALLGAGLAALIAIALVLIARAWWGTPDESLDPVAMRARVPMHFQCELCGNKFDLLPLDFQNEWKDVNPSQLPPGSRFKANCPKCGKPFCSRMLDPREITPPASMPR